jgi:hypothetical protein
MAPCFIKSHFGFDCPGCGIQRGFIALLKGEILQSIYFYPALIPLLLSCLALLVQLKWKHHKGGPIVKWMFIGTISIMLINFAVKLI